MKKINFTKIVASGNDFIIISSSGRSGKISRPDNLARKICHRKYGPGADGLLVLEASRVADVKMRIFNADGSQANMCGNGARCVSLYLGRKRGRIETRAGVIESAVNKNNVRIKLTDPKDIRLDIPLKLGHRDLKVNFIDTGVPHAVVFVEGLEKIGVYTIGSLIRNHWKFAPKGTNVDFVEALDRNSFKIRTFERGVEDETLSCGTGSVAAALIFALKTGASGRISVYTQSKEILKVYFSRSEDKFKDVWLEGRPKIVCKGAYYV